MATTRLLRTSRPLGLTLPSFCHNSTSSSTLIRCLNKAGATGDKRVSGNGERKSTVGVKALVASDVLITSERHTKSDFHLASLVANFTDALLKILRPALKRKSRGLQAQMLIQKVILDCRFFTLLAVAGSLLGSILCFVEGCFNVLQSYFEYFQMISQRSGQEHVVQLLIEAIDMFLVGTAMLMFGMGLYVMFVGTKNMKGENGKWLSESNLFGLFYLKTFPTWVEMQSISQAKSKIGHAVLMILQVGVLEKFKSIPLVNGLDLACFAGSVLISSACIFVLSRLSPDETKGER
ncbi:hypothetical protein HHK36_003141 [Tetracentron sinense]|uniref:Uncharacterized protein n=1 Tax=Tetracentron sinense TaxID=13715 RepID=A0A834ZMP3_TETSI|nr:hypothetical protein HHK36_003141 [Tetracentron sinense]